MPRPLVRERFLAAHHIAFFKGVAEGIDRKRLWDQYMPHEADFSEVECRSMEAWIREALIILLQAAGDIEGANAVRSRRPEVSRATQSLDEFISDNSLEELSEAEALELWREAHGGGPSREETEAAERYASSLNSALDRARLLKVKNPEPSDPVAGWFEVHAAETLERAGVKTLGDLFARVSANGSQWFRAVGGIGAARGEAIVKWLQRHSESLNLGPLPLMATTSRAEAAARPAAELRGSKFAALGVASQAAEPSPTSEAMRNQEPVGDGRSAQISASNDDEALDAWLAIRASKRTVTAENYRREIERLLLWAAIELERPASTMTIENCSQYASWLAELGSKSEAEWAGKWRRPQREWIGRVKAVRASEAWRPFFAPSGYVVGSRPLLNPSSVSQAIRVVRAWFAFLASVNYIRDNPWKTLKPEQAKRRTQFIQRSLHDFAWVAIRDHVEAIENEDNRARIKAAVWLGVMCGLRSSEMLSLTVGSIVSSPSSGRQYLRVTGKGGKERDVPLPSPALSAILACAERQGLPVTDLHRDPALPILFSRASPRSAMSRNALHAMLKAEFRACASKLAEADTPEAAIYAANLTAASTHWLRHTFGRVAVSNDMKINVVQRILGHASISTTTLYTVADSEEAHSEAERLATETFLRPRKSVKADNRSQ